MTQQPGSPADPRAVQRAVRRREFALAYQPVASIAENDISQVEALLRCLPPLACDAPALLLAAERSGDLPEIEGLVLERAAAQLREWRDTGAIAATARVTVNVRPRTLIRPGFVDQALERIDALGLDPRLVAIELSDRASLEDTIAAIPALVRLRARGVQLVLDDFGAGNLSYVRLITLRPDALKIDISLTAQVVNSDYAREIVAGIIGTARRLEITPICEGVETAEQMELLPRLGCDLLQGYYIARPAFPNGGPAPTRKR